MRIRLILSVAILFVSGCGGTMHTQTGLLVDQNVPFEQLQGNPDAFTGRSVSYEGRLLRITPSPRGAGFEIVECGFDEDGVPDEGRFLAITDTVPDPAAYKPGQNVVVTGEVKGKESRSIQGVLYTYPVVSIRTISVRKQSSCGTKRWDFGPGCCSIGQF